MVRKVSKFFTSTFLSKKKTIPGYLFCYHKVGTELFGKVFSEICLKNRWKFQTLLGMQTTDSYSTDVALYAHSLIDIDVLKTPFQGVHLVRDPRDIIISGYLYHKRTSETWCTHNKFNLAKPILFPNVAYSQQHKTEEWKANYIKSLNGKSYQQNLLEMNQDDGILFEMNNYGAWTINSMRNWPYGKSNILELKFEDLMMQYDECFLNIFKHFSFTDKQLDEAMTIAAKHDLGRKTTAEISKISHVSSPQTSKWKKFFSDRHQQAFIEKFGDILIKLGYEKANDW